MALLLLLFAEPIYKSIGEKKVLRVKCTCANENQAIFEAISSENYSMQPNRLKKCYLIVVVDVAIAIAIVAVWMLHAQMRIRLILLVEFV